MQIDVVSELKICITQKYLMCRLLDKRKRNLMVSGTHKAHIELKINSYKISINLNCIIDIIYLIVKEENDKS